MTRLGDHWDSSAIVGSSFWRLFNPLALPKWLSIDKTTGWITIMSRALSLMRQWSGSLEWLRKWSSVQCNMWSLSRAVDAIHQEIWKEEKDLNCRWEKRELLLMRNSVAKEWSIWPFRIHIVFHQSYLLETTMFVPVFTLLRKNSGFLIPEKKKSIHRSRNEVRSDLWDLKTIVINNKEG